MSADYLELNLGYLLVTQLVASMAMTWDFHAAWLSAASMACRRME